MRRRVLLWMMSCAVWIGCDGCEDSPAGGDCEPACRAGQVCNAQGRCVISAPTDMTGDAGDAGADMPTPDASADMPGRMCSGGRAACGAGCCNQGYACEAGGCACPTDILCDGICCGAGEVCDSGLCLPTCEGTRCGADQELCCQGEELCVQGSCETPGAACEFSQECQAGEVCEPTLGQCVPKPMGEVCEFRPPVGEFTPVVGCAWRPDGLTQPDRGDVVASPIVMNLADEGEPKGQEVPEIIFVSFDRAGDGCCNAPGTLRIVSGQCDGEGMRTIASITELDVTNDVGIASGDLDGDGVPEIVAVVNQEFMRANGTTFRGPQGTAAFKRVTDDGTQWGVMWFNETYPTRNVHTSGGPTISLADMQGDGTPEVIIGSIVLDGQTGDLRWDGSSPGGMFDKERGQGHNVFGPVSSVVDVDQDGEMEVFAGGTLYNTDGTVRWRYEYPGSNSPCRFSAASNFSCDGYNGVVNFDGDEDPELISVRLGQVVVLDPDGTLVWSVNVPKDDCANNESGPPTVADFDGDGRPEIGTAGADFYVVADQDCDVDAWEAMGCHSRGILWATPNQDCSSRSTASSVFDFEGDGSAEVVYVDETTFRILSGKTGDILFESAEHESNTRIELPVIADVDNDNNAEVLVASAWRNRKDEVHGPQGQSGLRLWQDASDNWVRTRRVWNQHSYHITNIEEDGTIPRREVAGWATGLNNYRQNVQPNGLFDAPDLVVRDLRVSQADCSALGRLNVYALLSNQGSIGVRPGVAYEIYGGAEGGEEVLIGMGETTQTLLPGQVESVALVWNVPLGLQGKMLVLRAAFDTTDIHRECKEDNNAATFGPIECELQR